LSGYDPDAYPPNYGEADKFVEDNTLNVKNNERYWQQRALDIQSMGKFPDGIGGGRGNASLATGIPGSSVNQSAAAASHVTDDTADNHHHHEEGGSEQISLRGGNVPSR